MNQTKKRLSIIKLAISITDIETIQLQILKLGLLRTDEKIQDIIAMLQTENYIQAQGLITTYIETPTEEIIQRSSQEKKCKKEEEQSTIDEFQLFVTPDNNKDKVEIDINDFINDNLQIPAYKPNLTIDGLENPKSISEIDINDFLSVSPDLTKEEKDFQKPKAIKPKDFDSLLKIDADDVLPNNIDLTLNYSDEEDNFFAHPSQSSNQMIPTSDIPKDNFFDTEEDILTRERIEKEINTPIENTFNKAMTKESFSIAPNTPLLEEKEAFLVELSPSKLTEKKANEIHYRSIPYLTQKLENMHKQYLSSHTTQETFPNFSKLLTKITQTTYTEAEIEESLKEVKELKKDKKFSQAMQLLLLCSATPSPFAQLILARELYQGVLLIQNIPQAFILLNTLAMDDYPEALCDLGQFYENGIGTKKDKKRAQELYKNAMELGIKRAKNHYERLTQPKKGFFSK